MKTYRCNDCGHEHDTSTEAFNCCFIENEPVRLKDKGFCSACGMKEGDCVF